LTDFVRRTLRKPQVAVRTGHNPPRASVARNTSYGRNVKFTGRGAILANANDLVGIGFHEPDISVRSGRDAVGPAVGERRRSRGGVEFIDLGCGLREAD
jgi:hypothetical protein